MKKYLLTGPSGTGKTTVAKELMRRGYATIETDNVPGLSSWTNLKTRELVPHSPPFTKAWLTEHRFMWNEERLAELLNGLSDDTFLVGDAFNSLAFLDSFDKVFAFRVDGATLIERLTLREPERWLDGSAEVKEILEWNERFPDIYKKNGVQFIDGPLATKKIADFIETSIHDS